MTGFSYWSGVMQAQGVRRNVYQQSPSSHDQLQALDVSFSVESEAVLEDDASITLP